jgi:cellobiose-specific phosphotransferase system component IIB
MATGVKTINGNYIDPFDEISFETVDNITATVTVPVKKENVATNSKIVFAFSDDINWDNTIQSKEFFTLYFGITNVTSSIKSFDYSKASKTLTITPNYLFYNGSYTISLIEGLTNKDTGQKIKPALFSFTTEEGDQACATASISLASLKGNRTILTPTINVDFTKPVGNTTSVNIGLYNGPILLKNFTRKWSSDKSKVDLVFNSLLTPNTEYTLKMIESVLDNQSVPIAPFDKQIEIADYLDVQCRKIDSVIISIDLTVQKLKEYRRSLIYEAVTGKIEV